MAYLRHVREFPPDQDERFQTIRTAYEQLTGLRPCLSDLREVAARGDKLHLFTTRLQAIRAEHARKPSLIVRLDKAGLNDHD